MAKWPGLFDRKNICHRIGVAAFIASLLSCSAEDKPLSSAEVIREETSVLDVRIDQGTPTESFASEGEVFVGFNSANESRMLIYFPGMLGLYEKDIIKSSIAQIEMRLRVTEVVVNPENILLYPLMQPWAAGATWQMAFPPTGESWQKGGGTLGDTAVTPAVSAGSGSEKILSFDLTSLVTAQILGEKPHYGFVLCVRQADSNYAQGLTLASRNSSSGDQVPRMVLVFSKKDSIQ